MIHIALLGAGAIGSRLALELARPDITLHVYDRDKVSNENIGTSSFLRWDISKHKSHATVQAVGGRNGNAQSFYQDITKKPFQRAIGSYDLVLDCLDNAQARNYASLVAPPDRLVHVGVTTGMGEVIWGHQTYVPDNSVQICTHQLGRNIICLTVAVAAMAIDDYLATMVKHNYLINANGTVMRS